MKKWWIIWKIHSIWLNEIQPTSWPFAAPRKELKNHCIYSKRPSISNWFTHCKSQSSAQMSVKLFSICYSVHIEQIIFFCALLSAISNIISMFRYSWFIFNFESKKKCIYTWNKSTQKRKQKNWTKWKYASGMICLSRKRLCSNSSEANWIFLVECTKSKQNKLLFGRNMFPIFWRQINISMCQYIETDFNNEWIKFQQLLVLTGCFLFCEHYLRYTSFQ